MKTIQTSNGKKGGTLLGKSHAEGGIKAVVVDTQRPIEVESGEVIINKHAAKKHWKELSEINQSAGNGVPIEEPMFAKGGNFDSNDKTEIYEKWKQLVNMSYSELKNFYDSEDGKIAGLTKKEADSQGIHSGRESAKWIMKMKKTPNSEWTLQMWRWAKRQISFVSRMSGMKGELYDEKGNKTRKHLALLIWGHNPEKYEKGSLIKRTDGHYSKHGLWDSIRENTGSGKKPTKEMLEQEKKIKQASKGANINDSSIIKNGYHLHFNDISIYSDSYNGHTPKVKSFCLITYNSGGQKNLKPIDTINSTELAKNLSNVLDINTKAAKIIVSKQMTDAKKIGNKENFKKLKNGNLIIADRDTIVYSNIDKFEKGGLLAPNGNPSNLTTEQYKLVRTRAFKTWFGDWENDPENSSKVVDENGEPLVVYHGTDKEFNVFDEKRAGELKTIQGVDRKIGIYYIF